MIKLIHFFKVLGLGAACVAGTMASPAPGSAQEKKVTIVSWGGSFQEAERKYLWEPFSKATGVRVLDDTWNGDFGIVKAQVESKNVTWDIVIADY